MTCKDCVNYEVCFKTSADNREHCEHFQDKSKFIELPCKIGDKVFIVGRHHHETYINTGRFRISDVEKIGKTVFITKEEAEQALKESSHYGL